MNIKLDVDATPQELRDFLGLPDVQPLQQEMMEQIREKMMQGVAGMDPATVMKPFLPEHMQSVEAWQKFMWDAFRKSAGASVESGSQGKNDGR